MKTKFWLDLDGEKRQSTRMNLRFIPLALALLAPAFAAAPAEDQTYPAHLLKVEARDGKPNSVLKMPLASYVNEAGQRVDLIGAVHVAESGYYRKLNKLFRTYDRVLYEMVDGEGLSEMLTLFKKVQAGTASEEEYRKMRRLRRQFNAKEDKGIASQLLAYYYVATAEEHQLMLQTEGIDYGYDNFVFADMSQDEFDRAMDARGENWLKMSLISLSGGIEFSDLFPKLTSTLEEKRRTFIRTVSRDSEGSPMEDMAIILDRNARCFEVLDRELQNPQNKKLGIFYGCMHLRDMDARLRERGFRLEKVEWMTAVRAVKKPRVKKN